MSTLLADIPSDIVRQRQQFFHLPEPMSMSAAEWEKLLPYVDNMYVLNQSRPPTQTGSQAFYWYCRFYRKTEWKLKNSGQRRQRGKPAINAVACSSRPENPPESMATRSLPANVTGSAPIASPVDISGRWNVSGAEYSRRRDGQW